MYLMGCKTFKKRRAHSVNVVVIITALKTLECYLKLLLIYIRTRM